MSIRIGDALDDLREVAARIVGRDQRERGAGRGRDARHRASKRLLRERINLDINRLTRTHRSQLRFLEICDDPQTLLRGDRHDRLAGCDRVADVDGLLAHHAVDGSGDHGIRELQARDIQRGLGGARLCGARHRLSLFDLSLLSSGERLLQLRLIRRYLCAGLRGAGFGLREIVCSLLHAGIRDVDANARGLVAFASAAWYAATASSCCWLEIAPAAMNCLRAIAVARRFREGGIGGGKLGA